MGEYHATERTVTEQSRLPKRNGLWHFVHGAMLGACLGGVVAYHQYVVRPIKEEDAKRSQCVHGALDSRIPNGAVSGTLLHRAVIANSSKLRKLTGEAFQVNGGYHSSGAEAFPNGEYVIVTNYICAIMTNGYISYRIIDKSEDEFIYISYSKEGEETGRVSLGADLGIGDIPGA